MRGFIIVILAVLTGCASPQILSYTHETPFAESDFRSYKESGKATLAGQAFLRTVGGDVKTCAGADVYLMPGTKYNIEKMAALQRGQKILGGNIEADKYLRKGICVAQGHFGFSYIPALSWIVATDVNWSVPSQDGLRRQGGLLMKTIDLHAGTTEVILTGDDRIP